jgi:hypothetical protein
MPSSMAAGMQLVALLACLLLAAAQVAEAQTVTPGRKWITLVGRNGCRDTSGWLGGEFCE